MQILFCAALSTMLMMISPAAARDCWLVDDLSGYSAHSSENYQFDQNRMGGPIIVCFTEEGGVATGLDVPLVKFGSSTLAGYGGNDIGNEMFIVYQLDRARGKMLFIQTRIGTETIVPLLPDVVHAFVGNAVRVDQ